MHLFVDFRPYVVNSCSASIVLCGGLSFRLRMYRRPIGSCVVSSLLFKSNWMYPIVGFANLQLTVDNSSRDIA